MAPKWGKKKADAADSSASGVGATEQPAPAAEPSAPAVEVQPAAPATSAVETPVPAAAASPEAQAASQSSLAVPAAGKPKKSWGNKSPRSPRPDTPAETSAAKPAESTPTEASAAPAVVAEPAGVETAGEPPQAGGANQLALPGANDPPLEPKKSPRSWKDRKLSPRTAAADGTAEATAKPDVLPQFGTSSPAEPQTETQKAFPSSPRSGWKDRKPPTASAGPAAAATATSVPAPAEADGASKATRSWKDRKKSPRGSQGSIQPPAADSPLSTSSPPKPESPKKTVEFLDTLDVPPPPPPLEDIDSGKVEVGSKSTPLGALRRESDPEKTNSGLSKSKTKPLEETATKGAESPKAPPSRDSGPSSAASTPNRFGKKSPSKELQDATASSHEAVTESEGVPPPPPPPPLPEFDASDMGWSPPGSPNRSKTDGKDAETADPQRSRSPKATGSRKIFHGKTTDFGDDITVSDDPELQQAQRSGKTLESTGLPEGVSPLSALSPVSLGGTLSLTDLNLDTQLPALGSLGDDTQLPELATLQKTIKPQASPKKQDASTRVGRGRGTSSRSPSRSLSANGRSMSSNAKGVKGGKDARSKSPRPNTAQDAFLAHRRWLDLQSTIREERDTFYEKVIRSDMGSILECVSQEDIVEIRNYAQPPALMEQVLSNTHYLLGLPTNWASIKKNLKTVGTSSDGFVAPLKKFQYTSITLKQLQEMRRRLKKSPGAFSPDVVQTISITCAALCRWVNVMCWRAGEQSWFHPDVQLLEELDKETISHIASYIRPPVIVAAVLGNVCCLLGLQDSWPRIQKHLKASGAFLQKLQYFEQSTIKGPVVEAIKQRQALYPHSFTPEVVMPVNATCAVLCKWVNAVCMRAGMDVSSINAGPRGRPRAAGTSGYQSTYLTGGLSTLDGGASGMETHQPIHQSNLEEMPGWSERVPIENKYIRPGSQTLSRSPSARRNAGLAAPPSPASAPGRYSGAPRMFGSIFGASAPNLEGAAQASSPRSIGSPRNATESPRAAEASVSRHAPVRAHHHFAPPSSSRATNMFAAAGMAMTDRARQSTKETAQVVTGTSPSSGSRAPPPVDIPESPGADSDGPKRHPDANILAPLEGPAMCETIAGVLKRPPKDPELVAFVLGNVHCLLGLDTDWSTVLESLDNFEPFLKRLTSLDQTSIGRTQLDALNQRMKDRPAAFSPGEVKTASVSCSKFAEWVNAVWARSPSS